MYLQCNWQNKLPKRYVQKEYSKQHRDKGHELPAKSQATWHGIWFCLKSLSIPKIRWLITNFPINIVINGVWIDQIQTHPISNHIKLIRCIVSTTVNIICTYIYIYIQYTYSPYHIISPLSPILSPYILAASAFAPSMKCHRHVIPRDVGIPRYHWIDVAVTWRLSPG